MITNKHFCESVYAMYKLLGGDGCAHCSDNGVSCGYNKENKVLTDALIKACTDRDIPYKMIIGKYFIKFEVEF